MFIRITEPTIDILVNLSTITSTIKELPDKSSIQSFQVNYTLYNHHIEKPYDNKETIQDHSSVLTFDLSSKGYSYPIPMIHVITKTHNEIIFNPRVISDSMVFPINLQLDNPFYSQNVWDQFILQLKPKPYREYSS